MAETYKELTELSREELIERHDRDVRYVVVGTSHYEAELRHREIVQLLKNIEANTSHAADLLAQLAKHAAKSRT